MKKVYCVKHFWGPLDNDPTEYFIQAEKRPTVAQAVEALGLVDYEPDRDEITIKSLEVYDLDKGEYNT